MTEILAMEIKDKSDTIAKLEPNGEWVFENGWSWEKLAMFIAPQYAPDTLTKATGVCIDVSSVMNMRE